MAQPPEQSRHLEHRRSAEAPSPIREEHQLLLAIGRKTLGPHEAEQVRLLLAKPLDSAFLLSEAWRHGLLPLLARHLLAGWRDQLPAGWEPRLLDALRRQAAENLLYLHELCRVSDLLESAGIPVFPLKGPILAQRVFGALEMRSFVDLDILVPADRVPAAMERIESMGYRLKMAFTPAQLEAYRRTQCELEYVDRQRNLMLELHWQLLPRYFGRSIPLEWLWSSQARVELGGRFWRIPGPEVLALYLCIHGTKHLWMKLELSATLAELFQEREFDWSELWKRAEAAHARRAALLGGWMAQRLFGAPLPPEWEERMRRWGVASLGESCCRLAFEGHPARLGVRETVRFHAAIMDTPLDRLKMWARIAVTTSHNDWTFAPLPPWLFWGYLLLRPFRLARDYWVRKKEKR